MSRKQFIEAQGATCKNWYWSWSFINKSERFVIFGEWKERPDRLRSLIFSEDWEFRNGKRNKGYDQSREHIRLIEEDGYRLFTFPMVADEPPEGSSDPVSIENFEEVLTEKSLRREGNNWFADEFQTTAITPANQGLKDTIKQILELQPLYSSKNTPEMAKRGVLVRTTLTNICKSLIPALKESFAEFAGDIKAEGSDGIGRKTEAPWVRIYSCELSPNAREGFYIVFHFSADGSAAYITVGCGSTIWSAGDLKSISDKELKKRTSWAKGIIQNKWGTLLPFQDEMILGAKAPLPETFEKATAFAKRLPANMLDEQEIRNLLDQAALRLAEIYRAQLSGRDVTPGDEAAEQIQVLSRPLRKQGRRQGFGLTASQRKAVELCAMAKTEEWLKKNGYLVEDTHNAQPYDFLAKKDGTELLVEVKGTISDICDSVLMTKNEVELHRSKKGSTALFLVSKILLERNEEPPRAHGGSLEQHIGWDIDSWHKVPIAFQISRPGGA
jgi:predicted HNH restriction endonuclease